MILFLIGCLVASLAAKYNAFRQSRATTNWTAKSVFHRGTNAEPEERFCVVAHTPQGVKLFSGDTNGVWWEVLPYKNTGLLHKRAVRDARSLWLDNQLRDVANQGGCHD